MSFFKKDICMISCLKWFKLLFIFITMNLFLFGLSKTETGSKTALRVPKLGYFDGRVPKTSYWVTLATSGAGMVCHMYLCYPRPPIFVNITSLFHYYGRLKIYSFSEWNDWIQVWETKGVRIFSFSSLNAILLCMVREAAKKSSTNDQAI